MELRMELENKSIEELYLQLVGLDSKRAKTIEKKNKRRLVRALEILLSNQEILPLVKKTIKAEVLILGIKKDREEIKNLILKRLEKRIELGMIDEVKKLKESGISSKRLDDLGLEYRYINLYLDGKLNLSEMKEQLYLKICQFAKRQMT